MNTAILVILTVACVLTGTVAASGVQQTDLYEAPVSSDVYDGDGLATQTQPVGIVHVPDASSVRVVFATWNLGARSRVILRSPLDGHAQHLNARTIARWAKGSAYFNGDSVEVDLEVAPGDSGVFVTIAGALVQRSPGGGVIDTICGTADNRVISNNPRVGRLGGRDPNGCLGGLGCTAWIFSNGALLTAGHCGPGGGAVVEFNVPLSNANGILNHPGPENQYIVDGTSVINVDAGDINDWSIFRVDPNTETGLLPVAAQEAFFRGSIDSQAPANIRITGFGYDDSPPGSCNWVNTHKAQQTHAGSYEGYVDNGATERYHRYRADTAPATSGSPVIMNGTTLTLGIHTNGGCDGTNPEQGANRGPSFRNTALRGAVEDYLGANARYADIGHPSALQFGTVFRPYDSVLSAFNTVPADGNVYVIKGNYTAANGNAVIYGGKHVTLRAPAGSVLIGN